MFQKRSYVYCVYKEQSFSRAAEKLHISQPSLSIAIRKEEEAAGALIFDRSTTPISLTMFGVEYIKGIRQIYELEERLHNFVYSMSNLECGSLSIGGSNLSIPYIVSERIASFKKKYPNINLKIVEASTIQLKHMLDRGELDFISTNQPMDASGYEKVFYYREHLVLAIPEEFPINQKLEDKALVADEVGNAIFSVPEERSVSLSELKDVPFILLNSGNYLRSCTDVLFSEAGVDPIIVLEVEQSSVSLNFANFNIGATIFSNRFVEHHLWKSSLKFYRILSKAAARDAYLYYRRGSYMSSAMERFLEMINNKQV